MIITAEEYKQALLNIQQGTTVVHTTLPATEPRFHVDLDTRTITIPDEFKFLATKKETKAETIYFVCDRYFDDIDLSTKTCVVQWINTDGSTTNRGLYPVTELDIDSIDGKIVFGWQIQSESTQIPGKIEFAISFYKIGEDELGENVFKYNLTTLATSSLILDTLDVWGSTTTPSMMPTELQVWLNQVNSIAKEANDNNNDTKAKIKEFNDNFSGKLTDINNTATSQIEAINNTANANISSINATGSANIGALNENLRANTRTFNSNADNVYNNKVSSINQFTEGKISDINSTAQSQISAIGNSSIAQIREIENHGNDILKNLGIVNNAKLYTDIYFDCQSYNRFMITSYTINGDDVIKNETGTIDVTKLKADGSTIVDKKITLPTDCAFNTEINIDNCAKIKIELGWYNGASDLSVSFTYALYSDYSDVTNKCDSTMNTLNSLAYLTIEEESNGEEIPISYATEAYVTAQINALREELKSNG